MPASAIESVEDRSHFRWLDRVANVSDCQAYRRMGRLPRVRLSGDHYGAARQRVLQGILDKIARDQSDLYKVGADERHIWVRHDTNSIRLPGIQTIQHSPNHIRNVAPIFVRPPGAGFQTREIEKIAHKAGEPIRFSIYGSKSFFARCLVERGAFLTQVRCRRLDRGQRAAQLVRNKRQQRVLESVRLFQRGSLRGLRR